MIRNIFFSTSVLVLFFGCASPNIYTSPIEGDLSKLKVESELNPFLLASIVTMVHKVPGFNGCENGVDRENTQLIMRLNQGNPLITNINEEGVNVPSGESLLLSVMSFEGTEFGCLHYVRFTPETQKSYEFKLSGQVSSRPFDCEIELWSKDGSEEEKVEFDEFHDCSVK